MLTQPEKLFKPIKLINKRDNSSISFDSVTDAAKWLNRARSYITTCIYYNRPCIPKPKDEYLIEYLPKEKN